MVVMMAILTIALFLLIDWLIGHEEAPSSVLSHAAAEETRPLTLSKPACVGGFQVQPEMAYHPGHAWALMEAPAQARVGMDDFAHRLVGKVDAIELPKPGDWLVQGEPAWTLHHGDRTAVMLSPVTGEVLEVNPQAQADASALASAPYADGWLLKVRSQAPRANLNNLLTGDLMMKWMEMVSATMRMRLSPGMAVSYPDGGKAVPDICSLVAPDQWKGFVKEYFLTEV